MVVDSREQTPLFLNKPPIDLAIRRAKLEHGDYSLQGFTGLICIERKRPTEIYSWLGSERKKTVKKLEAMDGMYWKGLIIEGTEEMLYEANKIPVKRTDKYDPNAIVGEHTFRSAVTPAMVKRALVSFRIRYNLHVYYALNRKAAQDYILSVLELFYTKLREGKLSI